MQDVLKFTSKFPVSQTKQKITVFLEWLSVHTTHAPRNYKPWLWRFFSVVRKGTEDCDTPEIALYKRWLEDHYKPATQSLAIVAVKQYFKFWNQKGLKCMSHELIRVPKIQAAPQVFLEKDEYEEMLKVCSQDSFRAVQEELILRLLWETNVRVSELTAMDIEHMELKERSVIVPNRKSRNVKIVAWSKATHEVLLSYLDLRLAATGGDALFIGLELGNKFTDRMNVRSVQRAVIRLAKRAGINKKLSPHKLRRGHAHYLLAQGLQLPYVSDYLGHSSWESTRPYLRSTKTELLKVVQEKLEEGT